MEMQNKVRRLIELEQTQINDGEIHRAGESNLLDLTTGRIAARGINDGKIRQVLKRKSSRPLCRTERNSKSITEKSVLRKSSTQRNPPQCNIPHSKLMTE